MYSAATADGDVPCASGCGEADERGEAKGVINRGPTLATWFACSAGLCLTSTESGVALQVSSFSRDSASVSYHCLPTRPVKNLLSICRSGPYLQRVRSHVMVMVRFTFGFSSNGISKVAVPDRALGFFRIDVTVNSNCPSITEQKSCLRWTNVIASGL